MKTRLPSLVAALSILGALGSASANASCVAPRDCNFHNGYAVAGERISVWVEGDGPDIDCGIYRQGRLVDSDTDSTDTCLVEFTARYSGQYTLKVCNADYETACYEAEEQ